MYKNILPNLDKKERNGSRKWTLQCQNDTRSKLEGLRNQLVSMINRVQQQQVTQTKTYQETSQTELKNIAENKKVLDLLANSIHSLNNHAEKSSKILTDHFVTPVRSCRQVANVSGKYVFRWLEHSKPLEVYCEQEKQGGGWIVIQNRIGNSVDFHRNWTEYRNGFGNVGGDFWLGLEYVHQMTMNYWSRFRISTETTDMLSTTSSKSDVNARTTV
ncbi:hypothetical protein ZHAS_00004506 [Anopheles sinensis]|uniref:Fibrinogen C-terminal domain-containing protein n=1 Tax=Anopheles sinensis TaxID=74873 RepID=A0A084VH45_ANOSI|nr:hypothetical protein ZHAS_00004506 [Anopheles sinensis]